MASKAMTSALLLRYVRFLLLTTACTATVPLLTRFYVIGDLHGDAECAWKWVKKTGLVDRKGTKLVWTGKPTEALYFAGDFVDKGRAGRATLELVRELTERWPDKVVAVLGNHDVYLLADALLEQGSGAMMGTSVRDFTHAFSHPEEYRNWVHNWSARDQEALIALFEALQAVYQNRAESHVFMQPLHGEAARFWSGQALDEVAEPLKSNRTLSRLVKDRLRLWGEAQSSGLRESGLASWLTTLPLVARVGDAVIVHGGLQEGVVRGVRSGEGDPITAINEAWWNIWRGTQPQCRHTASGPSQCSQENGSALLPGSLASLAGSQQARLLPYMDTCNPRFYSLVSLDTR